MAESPQRYENLTRAVASGLVASCVRSFMGFTGARTKADPLAVTLLDQQPLLSLPKVRGGEPLASWPGVSSPGCRK